jgi:OmpA-OmpF porin, OOP family
MFRSSRAFGQRSLFSLSRALLLVVLSVPVSVHAREPGRDHPAIDRYPGAVIENYDFKEYEVGQLVLSKPYVKDNAVTADKVLAVEGAVTYIHYELPPQVSTLQVFRNYQSVLRRGGFQQLYACERPCLNEGLSAWRQILKANGDHYLNGFEDVQYLSAKRGNTHVSLLVNKMSAKTHSWLFVIDKAALDENLMTVMGDSPIARALASEGRVDIYGFYFDTGKSKLKPDSAPTLRELAQVLTDNPALQIDVVGHTDNVGQLAANQNLSEARAQAVVGALMAEHSIDATRMAASGRGQDQPVQTNDTPDGRAKNRRVEIIARNTGTATPAVAGQPRPTPNSASANEPSTPEDDKKKGVDVDKAIDRARKLKDLVRGF